MADSGLEVIDRAIHETNTWLGEISKEMNHPDRQMAYHALRGVLFTLRDRLPVEEAMHLAAQLPVLIRGFYFEGYRVAGKPVKHDREAFLHHVSQELQQAGGASAEDATHAVLSVLARNIDEGEVRHLREMLPKDLLTLWPQEAT